MFIGNPFTAEWKLINGVFQSNPYLQLKSVRWMYANTPYGDRYLKDLLFQDKLNKKDISPKELESFSVGRQIDFLLTWAETDHDEFYEDLEMDTNEIYDV